MLSVGSVYEKENVGKATLFGLPLSSLNTGLTSGFAPFVFADAAPTVSVAASATSAAASTVRRKR